MTDQQKATTADDDDGRRWFMLAIIGFGYFAVLLNLVGIAAAFPRIAAELGVSYQEIALLVTVFLAGLAVGHIPSGLLSTRIGMKRVLVMGLALQAVAVFVSGFADTYGELIICRFVTGLGASAFASVAVGAISVWFEKREITLALGIGMAANSTGTAVGLFAWVYVVQALGWREALMFGGIVGGIAAVVTLIGFSTPRHISKLGGTKITFAALAEVLGSRQVWIYGLAFIGAYGGYMATMHLMPGYASSTGQFSAGQAGLVAAFIGLAGIPGSLVGGWLADRSERCRRYLIGPVMVMGALLAAIPFVPPVLLWPISIGIGFFMQFISAVWSSVPRRFAKIPHEHVSTAMGLLLTIGAFGGFVIPAVFGHLVEISSYTPGWLFLGAAAAAFGLIGFLGKDVVPGEPEDSDFEQPASAIEVNI